MHEWVDLGLYALLFFCRAYRLQTLEHSVNKKQGIPPEGNPTFVTCKKLVLETFELRFSFDLSGYFRMYFFIETCIEF